MEKEMLKASNQPFKRTRKAAPLKGAVRPIFVNNNT